MIDERQAHIQFLFAYLFFVIQFQFVLVADLLFKADTGDNDCIISWMDYMLSLLRETNLANPALPDFFKQLTAKRELVVFCSGLGIVRGFVKYRANGSKVHEILDLSLAFFPALLFETSQV